MVLQKDIDRYAVRMRMYASMLHDLAGSEEYIIRLIENNDLDAFEKALCERIRKTK